MTVSPDHTTSFSEIPAGDCFAFGDDFFQKLDTLVVVRWNQKEANATVLATGTPIFFADDARVIHLPKARINTQ